MNRSVKSYSIALYISQCVLIQSGALEQDSATLLSLQSQPSQMVINEVVHSMQQGALTVFNVKPLLGVMTVFLRDILQETNADIIYLAEP